MARAVLVLAAVGALLAVGLAASAQAPEGPEGLRLAFGDQGASTAVVTFSGPPGEASVEITGPDGNSWTVGTESTPLPGDDEAVYRARLGGLEPNATYTYRAVIDGDASPAFELPTAPAPGEAPVRLTMFADHGVPADSPVARHDGDAPIENMELARSMNATAHLIAGDISYANGDPRVWDVYFAKNEPLLASTPTMTVPGNHEREPGQGYAQYDARLTMPEADDNGRWWTSQVGNVQVVGLNSDTACAESQAVQAYPIASWSCAGGDEARQPNERQLAFLEDTLQAAEEDPAVDWTVVMHHNPVYSTGPHGSNEDVQAVWMPLYQEHGADLVLTGDDHFYQRTKPLVDGEPREEGTVYVVNGAGGGEAYEFEDEDEEPPEWEAARYNDEYGTLVLDADGDRLTGRFVDLTGTVVDTFALAGGADGLPQEVEPEASNGTSPPPDEGDDEEAAETPGPGAGLAVALAGLAALARRR